MLAVEYDGFITLRVDSDASEGEITEQLSSDTVQFLALLLHCPVYPQGSCEPIPVIEKGMGKALFI